MSFPTQNDRWLQEIADAARPRSRKMAALKTVFHVMKHQRYCQGVHEWFVRQDMFEGPPHLDHMVHAESKGALRMQEYDRQLYGNNPETIIRTNLAKLGCLFEYSSLAEWKQNNPETLYKALIVLEKGPWIAYSGMARDYYTAMRHYLRLKAAMKEVDARMYPSLPSIDLEPERKRPRLCDEDEDEDERV